VETKKSFKSLIYKMIDEICEEDGSCPDEEEELDEMTTTNDVEGYETPNAFSGKKSKKKKKKISTNSTGYKYFKEDVFTGSLKNLLFEKEEKKGGRPKRERGEVWQRESGAWAAKNSKGNVQSFKEKEAAEAYAKGRQGQHGFRKKGDEKPKNGDGDDKPKNGDGDENGDDKPKNGDEDDKPKNGDDKKKPEKKKPSTMKSLFGKSKGMFKDLKKDKFKSAISDLESQVAKDIEK
tara:strand:- start:791 stop:1495 length:705 start_codon:yes stop_codon:yes gene_type:complete